MDGNQITALPDAIFQPIAGLSFLDLTKNHLAAIASSHFAHNALLRTLLVAFVSRAVDTHLPAAIWVRTESRM